MNNLTCIEAQSDKDNNYYGRFIIEPLEKGQGITIGNALRRTILADLPGYAITSIILNNHLNAFSVMEGLREDIAEIVLNLKAIAFKKCSFLKKESTPIFTKGFLHVTGPIIVTAGMFKLKEEELIILNPTAYLCTIVDKSEFYLEIDIKHSTGYRLSEDFAAEAELEESRLLSPLLSAKKEALTYAEDILKPIPDNAVLEAQSLLLDKKLSSERELAKARKIIFNYDIKQIESILSQATLKEARQILSKATLEDTAGTPDIIVTKMAKALLAYSISNSHLNIISERAKKKLLKDFFCTILVDKRGLISNIQIAAAKHILITYCQKKTPTNVRKILQDNALLEAKEILLANVLKKANIIIQEKHQKKVLFKSNILFMDALFTPIKMVNYKIQLIHDAKGNLKESLILDILTNGSITPLRAIQEALKILITLISSLFLNPSLLALSATIKNYA